MDYDINPETLIPTAPLPRLRQAERATTGQESMRPEP